MKTLALVLVLVLSEVEGACLQQKPIAPPPPEVDPVKVDEAIKKGVAWLKTAGSPGYSKNKNCDELILLTMLHAGLTESDPKVAEILKRVTTSKLERTYNVSLQAVALEELDRVRFQPRIVQCAQFLVDNQCKSGQWSYGTLTPFAEDVPSEAPRPKDVASGSKKVEEKRKPIVRMRIPVERKREIDAAGDNSNSQYAALGLRACHDSGVIFPKDVIQRALDAWKKAQYQNPKAVEEPLTLGGDPLKPPSAKASTKALYRIMAKPLGWCYDLHKAPEHEGYGSMSAGAIASICIYYYLLDNDGGRRQSWKTAREVVDGLQWLSKRFSVLHNPGTYNDETAWTDVRVRYFYYLYALERTGMLYGTDWIGNNRWYPVGANEILKQQREDGSWYNPVLKGDEGTAEWDTCFAILFLKRATRPLTDVATGDRFADKK